MEVYLYGGGEFQSGLNETRGAEAPLVVNAAPRELELDAKHEFKLTRQSSRPNAGNRSIRLDVAARVPGGDVVEGIVSVEAELHRDALVNSDGLREGEIGTPDSGAKISILADVSDVSGTRIPEDACSRIA